MSSDAWITPRDASLQTYSKCGVSPRTTHPSAIDRLMAARLGEPPARERQLPRPGHEHHRDPVTRDAVLDEPLDGSVEQLLDDHGVVARRDHRHRRLGHRRRDDRVAPLGHRQRPRALLAHRGRSVSPSSLSRSPWWCRMWPMRCFFVRRYSALNVFGSASMGSCSVTVSPKPVQALELARVVREHADRGQAEVGQDLVADAVVARVDREAQVQVRVDRVVAVLLQLVGAQLVEQADAAALLGQVEQHPRAGLQRSGTAPARAARRSRTATSRRRRRSGTPSAPARARPISRRRRRTRARRAAGRRSSTGSRRPRTRRTWWACRRSRSARPAAPSAAGRRSGRRR